jgi:hypothetical protein
VTALLPLLGFAVKESGRAWQWRILEDGWVRE